MAAGWPVAVARLRCPIDGLATGEDKTRETMTHRRLEHIDHAEHVDIDAQGRIGLDFRAHQIGEMNAMRNVGMELEHCFNCARVGDIHRLHRDAAELGGH